MKDKLTGLFLSSIVASFILLAPALHAADGKWNVDANGLWSLKTNWLSNTIADGWGFKANFTNDITADRTVSLDGDRTLTSLVFGDSATGTPGSWILTNNGDTNNNLILDGTTPSITVNALGTGKNATISAIIEGTAGLVKSGNGTLILSGVNTYTGTTEISAGTVNVTGAAGTLGARTADVTLADVAGATLDFTGITGSRIVGALSGGGASGGNIVLGGSTFYFGSGLLDYTYGGIISGTGSISYGGGGTLTLTGKNTFDGGTGISNGALSINSISSVYGGASSLGNPTSESNGRIFIGSKINTGSLIYTGSGHTTDRIIDLYGTTGGATLNASGSGALVFTSDFRASVAGAKTLTLTGSSTADNRIGGAIVDSGNGTTSVTKSGAGKWILSGANTYTGGTIVSAGTLALGADNPLPATAVSIGTATLDASTFDDTLGTLDAAGSAVINLGAGANLVFADSSGIDWTGGTLKITGTFVSGSSIKFGSSKAALTSTQLSKISATGFTAFGLDANGYLTATAGGSK
jgi:autotransporter-associated beta strand protein